MIRWRKIRYSDVIEKKLEIKDRYEANYVKLDKRFNELRMMFYGTLEHPMYMDRSFRNYLDSDHELTLLREIEKEIGLESRAFCREFDRLLYEDRRHNSFWAEP